MATATTKRRQLRKRVRDKVVFGVDGYCFMLDGVRICALRSRAIFLALVAVGLGGYRHNKKRAL
jgi:hypothetical protein